MILIFTDGELLGFYNVYPIGNKAMKGLSWVLGIDEFTKLIINGYQSKIGFNQVGYERRVLDVIARDGYQR